MNLTLFASITPSHQMREHEGLNETGELTEYDEREHLLPALD
jgi:hypothetical protein